MATQTAKTTASVRAGLVGRGIGQSRTPAIHMAEGKAQGIDYSYEFLDMDRNERSLAQVLDDAQGKGFAGLNVTYPFKIEIISRLDELSENARALGAVNTVVFRDGKRFGHNTDLWGFSESFRLGMTGAARDQVLLLGAGGPALPWATRCFRSGSAASGSMTLIR